MMTESRPAKHVEHLVPPNGEERSSHALDVGGVHTSKPHQQLCLTHHLIRPLLLVEVCPKGVSDCVGSNLVTIGVEVLHLGIVRPLVGHIEGGLDGASVGVEPPPKEILVELLVQIVDGIVEGQEDELGDLVSSVAPGNLLSSTVAILKIQNSNWLYIDFVGLVSNEMIMMAMMMKIRVTMMTKIYIADESDNEDLKEFD